MKHKWRVINQQKCLNCVEPGHLKYSVSNFMRTIYLIEIKKNTPQRSISYLSPWLIVFSIIKEHRIEFKNSRYL